ncbi:hypothetical protein [Paenibacillus puerhi]|uniref:hypothetical protein n=1 Tax=Paenibacillus puerhi TaxID=2692622 RepID=UPI0013571AE5|nr:hypothetical protein [Paenibacillus puerhi]
MRIISISLVCIIMICLFGFPALAQSTDANTYDSAGRLLYTSHLTASKFIEYKYDQNGNAIKKKTWGALAYKDMSSILLGNTGSFESDSNQDGITDGWLVEGQVSASLIADSRYGSKSQQLQINGWGSFKKEIGSISPGKHFLVLIDYKTNASNTVSMRVNDTQTDWGLNLGYQYFITDNTWRTAYVKFNSTGNPITITGAYMDVGNYTVAVDGLRLFEITASVYNQIDISSELSGTNLTSKFIYGDILDDDGNFEKDANHDGIGDGWILDGHSTPSLSRESKYGNTSQQLQTGNGWASMYREIGPISAGRHFLVLVDYKASASNTVSLRVNDTKTDWGLNLGYHYFTADNTWRTAYVKFKSTGAPISLISSYIDPGPSTVHIDGLRLFEITEELYQKIGIENEYTGARLVEKFPFDSFIER